MLIEEPAVHDVKVRAPLQVLNSLWETGELRVPAYTRIGPANHHANYFDLVLDPRKDGRDALKGEIEGTNHTCSLCHESRASKCPGHRIGMILPFYIIQPEFANHFAKFLDSICLNVRLVGGLRGDGSIEFVGCGMPRSSTCVRTTLAKRFAKTINKCKHCGAERAGSCTEYRFTVANAKQKVAPGMLYYMYGGREKLLRVNITALLDYLTSPEIYENVGAAHELYGTHFDLCAMVTNILYVTPYQLRPTMNGRQHYETEMYLKIFSQCQTIGVSANPETAALTSEAIKLCESIGHLMSKHAKTPDSETQFQRLKGKYGLIRQYVTGAHSWNEGRGVVIPSPANFGEFVISRYYQSLLVMETVNRYNIGRLNLLADDKMIVWIKRIGSTSEVRFRHGSTLSIGDTVYRNVITGDVVIANRQPTLHRLALMGRNVKFTNEPVVALNRSETTPLNADHDGDDMTVFVALTPGARVELQSHAHALNCVHESGGPAMSVVFHELAIMMIFSIRAIERVPNPEAYLPKYTASIDLQRRIESYPTRRQYAKRHIFMLSEAKTRAIIEKFNDEFRALIADARKRADALRTEETFEETFEESSRIIDRAIVMKCMGDTHRLYAKCENHVTVSREVLYPLGDDNELLGTYGDVISLLFPESFSYKAGGIEIVNGVYISGEFRSSNIGLAAGSIVHVMHPSKRAALFINDVQRICDVYMETHGTTFDVRDMVYSDEYYNQIAKIVSSAREELEKALQRRASAISTMEREQIERKILLLTTASTGHIMKTIEQSGEKLKNLLADLDNAGIVGAERFDALQSMRDERIKNVFAIMYTSGCRGSTRTAVQMSMMLGPQYVGSTRADPSKMPWIHNPKAFPGSDGKPHQTALANGVIESSLIMGLTPEQYILHSDPTRYSIIRGKLDVGATGYISKLISTVYSFANTKNDMKLIYGTAVVGHAMGGWITPTSLMLGSYNGHGSASPIHIDSLVAETTYAFEKMRSA